MRKNVQIRLLQNMLEEITKKYDYFILKQDQMIKHNYDMATKDPLTGLYYRHYLEDYAAQAIDRMKRHEHVLILVFMDIDNFKYVNDTFGHDEGDKVLKKVSAIFQESLRKYDVIVRYGGDEFIIFLEEKSYDEAFVKTMLEKVVQRIEESLLKFTISASYGCSVAPQESQDLKELISIADEKMYAHKREKKAARV
jgi:diguanylate cyclase (GGDEF)-like protein